MTIITSPAPWSWESADWMSYTNHRGKDYGWYNANIAQSRQVVAAAAGRVVSVYGGGGDNLGWGNRVEIEHAPGFRTTYNHLATGTIKVATGQTVSAGQLIATMGMTGRATGIHLHFEVYLNGERVDPNPWFSKHIPGTAPAAVHPNDRVVGANGANARKSASTVEPAVVLRKAGSLVRMSDFTREGQLVSGNSVWFKGTDGYWYWAGGFTSQQTAGLNDLTPPPPPPPPVLFAVTFVDREVSSSVSVESGKPIAAPVAPVREGYTFEGWQSAEGFYDFSSPVVAPLTLTAVWEVIPEPTPEPVEPTPEPVEPAPAPVDDVTPGWFVRFMLAIADFLASFFGVNKR